MIQPFTVARIPRIVFGPGMAHQLPEILRPVGNTVLLVTGGGSLNASERGQKLLQTLDRESFRYFQVVVQGEPSPDIVDATVTDFGDKRIDAVLAVGGGSAIDAGKAISAMLPLGTSVFAFLEGVGTGAKHDGSKTPFIAVPTTSGTGSEATKNAVLSRVGPGGFKKSLRHDNFVPDVVVVDPELTLTCPAEITAACGMDAFTQLLESYISSKSSPMTDSLAFSGLEHIKDSLVEACTNGGDIHVRSAMAYASLLSGITLANAGLGVVHGLASPIGGLFEIPHGVVCGTLIAEATAATIQKLLNEHGPDHPALRKYARVGAMLSGSDQKDTERGCEMLVERITEWTDRLDIPRLSRYGIRETDFHRIIEGTGNKNNPVALDASEIRNVLLKRL